MVQCSMTKRIIYIAFLLALLPSLAWATASTESLDLLNYRVRAGQTMCWIPNDGNGVMDLYETFEAPDGHTNSGYDNPGWGETGTVDSSSTTVSHSNHGIYVLQAGNTSDHAQWDFDTDVPYHKDAKLGTFTEGWIRFYFRFNDKPTAGHQKLVELYDSSDDLIFLSRIDDDTDTLRMAGREGGWSTQTVSNLEDAWHYMDIEISLTGHGDSPATGAIRVWIDGSDQDDSSNALEWDAVDEGPVDQLNLGSGAGETYIYFDDLAVRLDTNGNSRIGDWAPAELLSDDDSTTYWATDDSDAEMLFEVEDSVATDTRLVRVWATYKEYGSSNYRFCLLNTNETNINDTDKTDYRRVSAPSTAKTAAMYSHLEPNDWSVWDNGDEDTLVAGATTGESSDYIGGIIEEMWVEVIYGDDFPTHDMELGEKVDTSVNLWTRLDSTGNVGLRYGTVEADVKDNSDATDVTGLAVDSTYYTYTHKLSGLTAADEYFFDVLYQIADTSYASLYVFETTNRTRGAEWSNSINWTHPSWANLPSCTMHSTGSHAYQLGTSADDHDSAAHRTFYQSLADDGIDNFIHGGDRWTKGASAAETERFALHHHGFQTSWIEYNEHIGCKIGTIEGWSDHDSFGQNGCMFGIGYYKNAGGVTIDPFRVDNAFNLWKAMVPVTDADLEVPTDLSFSVHADGGDTDTFYCADDTITTSGDNGIYPGMLIINITDNAYGFIESIDTGTSPDTIELASALTNSGDFDNGDSCLIRRAGIWRSLQIGDVNIVIADVRSKRGPNYTPGLDKLDGMTYAMIQNDSSKDLGSGSRDEYLEVISVNGNTITHNDTDIETYVNVWDMATVCETGTTTKRGYALIQSVSNSSGASDGTLVLDWAVDGLAATDDVYIYECGASKYDTLAEAKAAGHIQRSFIEEELGREDYKYRILAVETPVHKLEISAFDKWTDCDQMATQETFIHSDLNDGSGVCADCYYVTTTVSDAKPGHIVRYVTTSGTAKKPRVIEEVAAGGSVDTQSEWYWDEANDRVYIFEDEAGENTLAGMFSSAGPLILFWDEHWDRAATRRYMVEQFNSKNVIGLGWDRHLAGLQDQDVDGDNPWYFIAAAPAHLSNADPQGFTHFSCREWTVDDKNAWQDYSTGGANFACYGVLDLQTGNDQIVVTIYDETGAVVTNSVDDYPQSSARSALGNMTMDISFVDYAGNGFGRGIGRGVWR